MIREQNAAKMISMAASVAYLDLTELELEEKLEQFRGVKREVDGDTSAIVGKLLLSDEEEGIDAEDEAFSRLYGLVGGLSPLVVFVIYAIF